MENNIVEAVSTLQAQLSDTRIQLDSHRRMCRKHHVFPLSMLICLPVGTVISKELDVENDREFWKITIGEDCYKGVALNELLSIVKI